MRFSPTPADLLLPCVLTLTAVALAHATLPAWVGVWPGADGPNTAVFAELSAIYVLLALAGMYLFRAHPGPSTTLMFVPAATFSAAHSLHLVLIAEGPIDGISALVAALTVLLSAFGYLEHCGLFKSERRPDVNGSGCPEEAAFRLAILLFGGWSVFALFLLNAYQLPDGHQHARFADVVTLGLVTAAAFLGAVLYGYAREFNVDLGPNAPGWVLWLTRDFPGKRRRALAAILPLIGALAIVSVVHLLFLFDA